MTNPVPSIGRIVIYTLSDSDALAINDRRQFSKNQSADGRALHHGNRVNEGDEFPMIITKVWGTQPDSAVNGQVFLDGDDLFWATSTSVGDSPAHFRWPHPAPSK